MAPPYRMFNITVPMFFCRTKAFSHVRLSKRRASWLNGFLGGNGRATKKVIIVGLLHLSVRADCEEKTQKADVTSGSLELVLQQSWSGGWHLYCLREKTRRDLQSCGFLANKIIKNTLSLWDMLPGRVPDGTSIGYQKKIWTIKIHTVYTPKSSSFATPEISQIHPGKLSWTWKCTPGRGDSY